MGPPKFFDINFISLRLGWNTIRLTYMNLLCRILVCQISNMMKKLGNAKLP